MTTSNPIDESIGKSSMPEITEISGMAYTAMCHGGKWFPTKLDLRTGNTVQLAFGFDLEDDAIGYAMDNFA